MKEIALTGLSGQVFADVLSALLHRGVTVNALVNNPERLMDTSTQLTASLLDVDSKDVLKSSLTGYDSAIFTFDDNLEDHDQNDFVLQHYNEMVNAARDAGIKRLIVVGSPESEYFFAGDLKRREVAPDWVFISTEGDYAKHAVDELLEPRTHNAVFCEETAEA